MRSRQVRRSRSRRRGCSLSRKTAQPGRICPEPRCPNLQPCEAHPRKPFANAQRTGTIYYQTARWKQERADYLAANPRCLAYAAGLAPSVCTARSAVVDHIQPHRGDYELFWAQTNWQALCGPHHQVKTGRETRERVATGIDLAGGIG